jgi:hypothetical protein
MMSFSYQPGLNPALSGKGLRLNKITLFAPATLPPGPPNAARGLKNFAETCSFLLSSAALTH